MSIMPGYMLFLGEGALSNIVEALRTLLQCLGTFLEHFVKVSRGERNGKGKLSKSRAKERERKALLIQARER